MGKQKNWPLPSMPTEREPVRAWAERQTNHSPIPVTSMDFFTHNVYSHVQIKPNDQSVAVYWNNIQIICNDNFNPEDWFVTSDLRVWFTNNDDAVLFKLLFPQ